MTIVRAYPVARERAVATDVESTARKMATIGRMVLEKTVSVRAESDGDG
jgi:hypothetical protein